MKAIILAGGEGTRLRPLSVNRPKPMLRLFDRPLLEHIVLLLRDCGFTELCMTLHYLPEAIRSWFGDGQGFGVHIEYRTEREAAGTAGSVRACRDFAEGEDFLVIGGDAACSFDLRTLMEKHRISGAEGTVLVQKRADPGEYGLVLTDADRRILRFTEKPGPEKICSDLINTGIYVFSPSVFDEIPPEGSFDFGADLFPRLLRNKRRLLTWEPEGYWNDAGTCAACLEICRDVLEGRFRLPSLPGPEEIRPGPCWISPGAEVSEAAAIGPWTAVGAGSVVAEGCRIGGSLVDGAVLQPGCEVQGSILSRGAALGRETRLREGCVLAEGVSVGAGSLLREGVRLWPGVSLPAHSLLSGSLSRTLHPWQPRFREGAALMGEAATELTPELLLRMGRSVEAGRVAAAADSGYGGLLAEAFLLGAGAAGKETFRLDAPLAAAAAAAAPIWGLDTVLFVRQEGSALTLRFFDADGLPLSRKSQRTLEAAGNGESPAALREGCAAARTLRGTAELWISDALRGCGELKGLRVACDGPILSGAFRRGGASICGPGGGVPRLRLADGGFSLSAADETGREIPWPQLLCALVKAELRSGAGAVVLPYAAPMLAERIAEEENGTVCRLERDGGEALRLYRRAPRCRDGLTLALRLFSLLNAMPEPGTLAALIDSLPASGRAESTVQVGDADTAILRRLARDEGAETVSGVRLKESGRTATVRRLRAGELRILTEAASMEAAEEFSEALRSRIRQMSGTEPR